MMGCVFDGYASHMKDYEADRTFLPLEKESTREQIIEELRKSGAEIMVNYLPVGSEEATRFYAACALEANLGLREQHPGLYRQRSSLGKTLCRQKPADRRR